MEYNELRIISENSLKNVSAKEIDSVIAEIMEISKDNVEDMVNLTVECTTYLSSSGNKAKGLSEQGPFKKIFRTLTGKNAKLRAAILEDNSNALYAAQSMINCVMQECNNNARLMLAINDRVSCLYWELQKDIDDAHQKTDDIRNGLVAFYRKFKELEAKQSERISDIEQFEKSKCPKCSNELLAWQRVCPKCGNVHILKTDDISERTKKTLGKISDIVKDESFSGEAAWNAVAEKKERVMRKAKELAKLGGLPGYTEEFARDIESFIDNCRNEEFQIAVVGVMKAGKSYLMNALMGTEIASVEVNPETAALTKFRSSKGFYYKLTFHNKEEWKKLKDSASKSRNAGQNSLSKLILQPEVKELEKKWIGHDPVTVICKSLAELKEGVRQYTSSRTLDHLFVSEVEVGVDRKIFNMPNEVIFVDTPGLKDPVAYRSEITRDYIKRANAVLIAVPTQALTAEGNEIITTVLDCTDADKAYIVATQTDKQSEDDCEKIFSLWAQHLVAAKRYKNERIVKSRIVATSSKMELLLNKWLSLDDKKRNDPKYFSDDDYADLEGFVKKILDNRRYNISDLPFETENIEKTRKETGIKLLRGKLEETLISKYRTLKIADIEEDFKILKKRLNGICNKAIESRTSAVESAKNGVEALNQHIEKEKVKKSKLEKENEEIRHSAEQLDGYIKHALARLE